MRCFICGQEPAEEETLAAHVQHDIHNEQYGIQPLALAQCLASMMERITKLERSGQKEVKPSSRKVEWEGKNING
jgi:hypothetical protein